MSENNLQEKSTAANQPQSTQSSSNKSGIGVSASPLNAVKLELALILVLGISLGLIIFQYVDSDAKQFLYLAGYGFVSGSWIVLRTRTLAKRSMIKKNLVNRNPKKSDK